jgi:glycosyltransferase involved in cell wall biosynthesis
MPKILVPAYNEEGNIGRVVKDFARHGNVVVCDNGSSDRTAEEAKEAGAKVIKAPKGKGNAVRELLKEDGDVYLLVDGDGAFSHDCLEKVLDPIRRGKADMVIAKRLNIDEHNRKSPFIRRITLRLLQYIFNKRFHDHNKIYDFMSGMRAFTKQVQEKLNLKSNGFGIETEMTIQAIRSGLVVKEVDVLVNPRRHGMQKSNIINVGLPVMRLVMFG